jgi:hypothetical protein
MGKGREFPMKAAVFAFLFIAISIGISTFYIARFLEKGDF